MGQTHVPRDQEGLTPRDSGLSGLERSSDGGPWGPLFHLLNADRGGEAGLPMMVPALGDASSPQQDATIPVTSGLSRAAVGQATSQPPPPAFSDSACAFSFAKYLTN